MPVAFMVLGGVIAYVAATALIQANGADGSAPTVPAPAPSDTQDQSPLPSPTASADPEPVVSEEPAPPPPPPVDLAANVAVLNGAGIQGLAGRQQAELQESGFTAVTATNLTGSKPANNIVRYADAAQASTAARVAEVLGITAVEQGTTSGAAIDVILVSDPDR